MNTSKEDLKLLHSLDDLEFLKIDGKDKLGKGSFASVRLVRHLKTGQLYALKEVFFLLKRLICLQVTTLSEI